ncbi:hypothetical protein HK101_002211 [Irineochytrium annulatum]|nr:hypothetical protein HK101_002211 [Irineochytrium annulatum]
MGGGGAQGPAGEHPEKLHPGSWTGPQRSGSGFLPVMSIMGQQVNKVGNQLADSLATGHTGPQVEEVAAYQTEEPWTVFAGDTEVEGHVRRTLTDVYRHQAVLEFFIQPRHDYLLAIAGTTDWELTFWILHDGNFV